MDIDASPHKMSRRARVITIAGLCFGLFGGLVLWLCGEWFRQPNRLSYPGVMITMGTLTFLRALARFAPEPTPLSYGDRGEGLNFVLEQKFQFGTGPC